MTPEEIMQAEGWTPKEYAEYFLAVYEFNGAPTPQPIERKAQNAL